MPVQSAKRGAIPTQRSALAAAAPYTAPVGAPPTFIVIPKQLSFWGNDNYGDCVTAEEAFAKACSNPETFIAEDDVIAWATRHGVLNGAGLPTVMTWMQTGGFPSGDVTYDDGSYSAVEWTNAAALQSAIFQGPVKLCIAADQLDATWQSTDGQSGWFATGYHEDTGYDHCTALCGYGSIAWLAGQLGVAVPAGTDGAAPGYAMFTWDSIGIIDVPSMIAITAEAWLRRPTTVRRPETMDLFVSVYNDQQHFTYLDGNGNLQDCWYDGPNNRWNLQQINNANGSGATVAGEPVAAAQATAAAAGGFFVCQYNNQDHFAYLDVNGNIQDCWYDGRWNLQQINRGTGATVSGEPVMTNGPTVAGDLFVSVYNDQQHFTYRDGRGNVQDCWYDGPNNRWNLQQINDANGAGATVAGEPVATARATAAAVGGLFVCQYMDAGDGTEPLFLQPKEAQASALAAYCGRSPYASHGERVVAGQLLMQAESDIFLGWTQVTGPDGVDRDYYVRQLKDWKFSFPIEQMIPSGMAAYAQMCGWSLARAHAVSGDRIALASYLGGADEFAQAIADFAETYADQNDRDYAALQAAVKDGRVQTTTDI